jgi:hypothetical protein|nr:MAG TPA: hypothetical protein [Caudoviricetes sp.]
MDYVILCTMSGLIALLLCEHLSIAPRRKELEELKRGNEDNLRELYDLRGQKACLSEELEQLKAKSEDDLRKLREENGDLTSELDKFKGYNALMLIAVKVHIDALKRKGNEINSLRQQKEALEKELLEQVGNQSEKRNA